MHTLSVVLSFWILACTKFVLCRICVAMLVSTHHRWMVKFTIIGECDRSATINQHPPPWGGALHLFPHKKKAPSDWESNESMPAHLLSTWSLVKFDWWLVLNTSILLPCSRPPIPMHPYWPNVPSFHPYSKLGMYH